MKKILLVFLSIHILAISLFAKHVNSGAVMCNNLSSITKLKEAMDTPRFWNVWGEVTSSGECAEVSIMMTDNGLPFIDLGNGITKINNIYVFTREVKN